MNDKKSKNHKNIIIEKLFNKEESPLPHFLWSLAIAYKCAPLETIIRFTTLLIRRIGPVISIFMLKKVINEITIASGTSNLLNSLSQLVLVLILTESGTAISKNFGTRLQEKMTPFLSKMVLEKSAELSVAEFENNETFNLIERATKDGGNCVYELMGDMLFMISIAVGGLSALVLLIAQSPLIALIGLIAAIPITISGIRIGQRVHQIERSQSENRRFSNYIGDVLSTREIAKELKAYQLKDYFLNKWEDAYQKLRSELETARIKGVIEGLFATIFTTLLFGLSLYIAITARSNSLVNSGQIIVLIGSVRILQTAIVDVASNVGYIWQFALPVSELRRFLELPHSEFTKEYDSFNDKHVKSIEFVDVSFKYPGANKYILRNVNLKLKSSKRYALVGENGAGKSTFVKLLLGLYTPTTGKIKINNVDIRDIDSSKLRRLFSCVFQDFNKYEVSLLDNIRFGHLSASLENIEMACLATDLDELIMRLPDRLNSLLGKSFSGGTDLSGGQWQRIAIARAFVRDSSIIILDEPTSALDPRSEMKLYEQFLKLVDGKTALIITHRLGSARGADEIIVLKNGVVAETGTHEELMIINRIYSKMFSQQASWYI